jgi:hypothetical protein
MRVTAPSLFALILAVPAASFAQGCADYPYTDGISIEEVSGGTKILSTATATVSFDDVDSVKDARDEATLEAKAAISKFMNETIKSDEAITKAVSETKSMQGSQKDVSRREVIERVKKLQNSSQALLRGVVVLGDCYSKGREVRVSVGLKPETIDAALNLQETINRPSDRKNQPASGQTSKPGTSLQNVDEFSNTKKLKDF